MTPSRARFGVDAFTAVMIVSVGVALAGLSWRIAGDPGTAPAVSPAASPIADPVDLAPIIALAPFGSATAPASGAAAQSMQLHGILLATPIEASAVLIASGSGPVTAYRIGQTVGGAIIESVAIDHAVLRTADGMTILAFPERASGGSGVAAVAAPRTPPRAAAAPPGVEAIRALLPESVRGGAPGSAAAEARPHSAASSGGASFLDSLAATSTPGGYRVGSATSPAMKAAGLQAGDVIERVNGIALGDPARNQQMIADAIASGSAKIEIRRDGRQMTLSVSLR